MNAMLRKEMCLSASVLSYIFLAAAVMTLIPGYPILCGAFFITLGIFQSFQSAREANDIVYSALLPVAKSDVVKGKFMFSVLIELLGFLVVREVLRVSFIILCFSKHDVLNSLLLLWNFIFLFKSFIIL